MDYIDLDRFDATPICREPFDHVLVEHLLQPGRLDAVAADFPDVPGPGSHPQSALRIAGHFKGLMSEMESRPFRAAVERKFGLDLEGRPLVYTVRGMLRSRDGAVHCDSDTKLVTVLLYLNASWSAEGGRLRLLRSPDHLDEPAVEVAPGPGTLLVFRCGPSSWHGHLPFEGKRRTIQMNWVTSEAVAHREARRHHVSSRFKALRRAVLPRPNGVAMIALLLLAGFVAGFLNVMAGGGSFVTLPALIAAGLPAVSANATSTVGMFPSQAATAVVARSELRMAEGDGIGVNFAMMCAISLVGGALGGGLLLVTPPGVFIRIIPWLILFATLLFAAGNTILAKTDRLKLGRGGVYGAQGFVAIYGGYFGGGIGFLMLAALTLYGLRDLRVMNNMKIVWAVLMNVAACATFAFTSLIHWFPAAMLTAGSLAGSYVGIRTARRIPAVWAKRFIVAVGLLLSLFFFLR